MATSPEAARMAEAAQAFLSSLDPEGLGAAALPFEEQAGPGIRRRDWHYIPRRRDGLSFVDMTAVQEKAAYDLVASAVALPAFAAITTIIGLEDVLDRMEGGGGPRRGRTRSWGRHRGDYSATVFGSPGEASPWGFRFEGHHVSVNVTVVDGAVACTPMFLGSNPAETLTSTGHVVARPLAAEEEVFIALIGALAEAQRAEAFLGDEAPDDIVTGAAPEVVAPLEPKGLPLAALRGDAAALAESLVRLYVDRAPPEVADRRWQALRSRLGDVHLAWAGEARHRRPQYYRLQGPSFLVEYDNTQNDANHVHTVVRDPAGDFGDDLLRAHRARHHH